MKVTWLIMLVTGLLTYQKIQAHPAAIGPPGATNEDVISMEEPDSELQAIDPPGATNEDVISMEKPDSELQEFNEAVNSENDAPKLPLAIQELQDSDENADDMETLNDFEVADTQQFSSYTKFRGRIYFYCNSGRALYYMRSYHSNSYEDRRWKFGCRKISSKAMTGCHWLRPNSLNGMLISQCPNGYAVTRIYSAGFNVGTKDRQFYVMCCKATTLTNSCGFTSYLNAWDGTLNYAAGTSYAIAGIFSHHDNGKQDRRFVVRYCKYKC